MPFSVYNSTGLTTNKLGSESPAFASRFFSLQERTGTQDLIDKKTSISTKYNITGIAMETPQISYSTTLGIAPHVSLANKVNDLFKNDLFKLMASSNREYKPLLLTDGWSQQYPKEGAKVSVNLHFRAYPTEMYNTTDYFTIFKMLFYCSAPKKYGFGNNITILDQAITTAAEKGLLAGDIIGNMLIDFNELRKRTNGFSQADKDAFADALNQFDKELDAQKEISDKLNYVNNYSLKATDPKQRLIESAAYLVTAIETFAGNTETACPRFTMSYGNLFQAGTYNYWIIDNWSCKPSVNTTILSDGRICPIYVDFTINIRTAGKVGTTDLASMLMGTSNNIAKTEIKTQLNS